MYHFVAKIILIILHLRGTLAAEMMTSLCHEFT